VASPVDSAGDLLRFGLHAHTTNSEGALPPEMLVRHYEWAGSASS
jgi:predicted metal-dependent phosphoesterase TrpH